VARTKGRVLLASSASALLSVVVLWITLRLDKVDLHFPLNYLADANIFLMRAKSIVEGSWIWWNPRVGMPFGADWRDFPMNITLDSALMWMLSHFTSNPALILNLEWIIAIAVTAALACYAMVRLDFSLTVAASSGAIFALLPYEYFRATLHLHSLYYAIPLVALAAINVVRGKWANFRDVPAYAWIGCVVAGLTYAYTAFFAVFVLLAAGVLGFLKRRRFRALVFAAALAGTVGATALVDLSPSLWFWARNGSNARMVFKSPAETELYGLKIRYLITPVPDHPLPLFRAAEARLAEAKYPKSLNENEWGRLGTFGSIGFLYLLVFAVGAAVSPRFGAARMADLLGPCAGLTLLCVLLASVGGFSDFFSAFVSPDIRCYTRIFPFIGFFSVVATSTLLPPLDRRLAPVLRIVVFTAIVVLAGYDQAVPSRAYDHSEAVYRRDDDFVRQIETVLPANSAVFQLPYTDFPNEIPIGKLLSNDLLRPYLHSQHYRWSWPAVSGTTSGEWNRMAAALPVPEMLRSISQRGFSGLWLDEAGYEPGASPEKAIAQEIGAVPRLSEDGRFAFFDLRAYAAALQKAEAAMPASERIARNPVQVLFERGFYYEERGGGHAWHWSSRHGRITLVNPLDAARKVTLAMRIQTADGKPHNIRISHAGGTDHAVAGTTFSRTFNIPPSEPFSLDLICDCPAVRPAGGGRLLYFFVSDVAVHD
jgi:phosphoglycerol transferase